MLSKIEKQRQKLEGTLKLFEKNLSTEENQCVYNKCKQDHKEIYDNIAESIHMRHKYQWYEKGERSSTFFLDLEEFTLKLIQICKITVNVKEAPDLNKIQYDIDCFISF